MATTAMKKPMRNTTAPVQTPAEQAPAVAGATVMSFEEEMHEQSRYFYATLKMQTNKQNTIHSLDNAARFLATTVM